jgi:hypothetical protein
MRRCDVRLRLCAVPTLIVAVALLAGLAVLSAGCASPPIQPSVNGEAAAQGGTAASDVSETTTTPATAFAQPGGSADAKAVTAKVDRTTSSAAAGEAIQGVVFPGGAQYMKNMTADAAVVSISERINAETAKEVPDDALLDKLYADFEKHAERVKETTAATCPDFGSLKTINVMILVCKDNGAAEGETGDIQSQAVADAMAKVVAATVGDG